MFKGLFSLALSLGLGLSVSLTLSLPVLAAEQAISFEAYQGLNLPGKVAWPDKGKPEAVKEWVLLIHGSGAMNMDAELAEASEGGKSNPFFKHLSDALIKQGFGVMRFDKRAYQIAERFKTDTEYVKSEAVQSVMRQPVTFLIEDAWAAVKWLHQRYPQARVHLLGHSEGTNVALQITHAHPAEISSLGLIGFFANSFDTMIFEQTVYRYLPFFTDLDLNRDQVLDTAELAGDQAVARALRVQLPQLDLNKDGHLSQSEYQAARYASVLLYDLVGPAFRRDEALYPRPNAILPAIKQPVSFFVGELDNQTPAYQTRAVAIANQHWQKPFYFQYFPGLGHALDPRPSDRDLIYRQADPKALAAVAARLKAQLEEI